MAYSIDVITARAHSHQLEIMFLLCTSYLSFWPRDRVDILEGKFASFEDEKISFARLMTSTGSLYHLFACMFETT